MHSINFIVHMNKFKISLQLGSGGWRRPLTMGYQTSETHEQFRNQPDTIPAPEFDPNPQGFMLSNHHTDGPSKVITFKCLTK